MKKHMQVILVYNSKDYLNSYHKGGKNDYN